MQDRSTTLLDLHWQQSTSRPDDEAIAFKKNGVWEKISWRDYYARSRACAAALVRAGVLAGDRVALLSENRLEWPIADMGIMAAGAVAVPLHATTPRELVEFQLRDAEVSWTFVSSVEQLEKVRSSRGALPHLRGVTMFDNVATEAASWEQWQRMDHRPYEAALDERRKQTCPDSPATIIYTSGTTGRPRGVELTHGNLASSIRAVYDAFPLKSDTSTLTWLPLSHIAARSVEHFMILLTGGVMWLAESPDKILANLAEVQPTNLSGVPRFYEKLLAAVHSAESTARRARLRAIFGSRVNWVTCGSAAISQAVVEEFRKAGLPILEAYGLTETAGVVTCNRPDQWRVGTVGKPLPGIELKTAPDDEILVRGPILMAGYRNDLQLTRQTIRDGWLHTGDTGRIDSEGFLTITGRKKDLLVLSTGKKVAASEVERRLVSDQLIDQVVVYGEGRSFLAALVVPGRQIRERLQPGNNSDLVKDTLRQLSEYIDGALSPLAPEMRVKRFLVLLKEFSVDAGELTETLKPRRAEIFAKYRMALDRLYAVQRTEDQLPLAQLA